MNRWGDHMVLSDQQSRTVRRERDSSTLVRCPSFPSCLTSAVMVQVRPLAPRRAEEPGQACYHRATMTFTIILSPEAESGYSVICPAIPGCASQGNSLEEALANIREPSCSAWRFAKTRACHGPVRRRIS